MKKIINNTILIVISLITIILLVGCSNEKQSELNNINKIETNTITNDKEKKFIEKTNKIISKIADINKSTIIDIDVNHLLAKYKINNYIITIKLTNDDIIKGISITWNNYSEKEKNTYYNLCNRTLSLEDFNLSKVDIDYAVSLIRYPNNIDLNSSFEEFGDYSFSVLFPENEGDIYDVMLYYKPN